MGGKGRGELLKTLIWSIQFEHDDDDDQYWVNIKVWEAVQISGISRTESEKHEKLAVGSTCRCSSMLLVLVNSVSSLILIQFLYSLPDSFWDKKWIYDEFSVFVCHDIVSQLFC